MRLHTACKLILWQFSCPAEIGIGLTGLGFLFLVLGVLFFFDKGLIALGNVSISCTEATFYPPSSMYTHSFIAGMC